MVSTSGGGGARPSLGGERAGNGDGLVRQRSVASMIDHFGINCADLEASARFYDAVLAVLGHRRLMDVGVAIGYGTDKPDFWIAGGDAASGPNREIHVGFTADSADIVRRWYATALELGAESLHEPRL